MEPRLQTLLGTQATLPPSCSRQVMGPAVPSGCPGEEMTASEVYSLPAWPARGSCFQQPYGKCKRSPQSPVACGKVGRPEGRVWSRPHWGGCQGSGCSPEAGKGGHSLWPLTSGSNSMGG